MHDTTQEIIDSFLNGKPKSVKTPTVKIITIIKPGTPPINGVLIDL